MLALNAYRGQPIPSSPQAFTLSSLAFMTIFVNSLFSLFRSRLSTTAEQTPAQQQQVYPLAPSTPYPTRVGWRPDTWEDPSSFETASRRRRLDNGGAAKVS